jgi:hypothetical protein
MIFSGYSTNFSAKLSKQEDYSMTFQHCVKEEKNLNCISFGSRRVQRGVMKWILQLPPRVCHSSLKSQEQCLNIKLLVILLFLSIFCPVTLRYRQRCDEGCATTYCLLNEVNVTKTLIFKATFHILTLWTSSP